MDIKELQHRDFHRVNPTFIFSEGKYFKVFGWGLRSKDLTEAITHVTTTFLF